MTVATLIASLLAAMGWAFFLIERYWHHETRQRLHQGWKREEDYGRMVTDLIKAHRDELSKAIIILALLLLPSLASAQSLSKPVGAIIAGNALDYGSTEMALQRPGVREGNPFGQTPAKRLVMKSAGTAVQVWLVTKLAPTHPKLAAGIGYGIGAAFGAVALHNWKIARGR